MKPAEFSEDPLEGKLVPAMGFRRHAVILPALQSSGTVEHFNGEIRVVGSVEIPRKRFQIGFSHGFDDARELGPRKSQPGWISEPPASVKRPAVYTQQPSFLRDLPPTGPLLNRDPNSFRSQLSRREFLLVILALSVVRRGRE